MKRSSWFKFFLQDISPTGPRTLSSRQEGTVTISRIERKVSHYTLRKPLKTLKWNGKITNVCLQRMLSLLTL